MIIIVIYPRVHFYSKKVQCDIVVVSIVVTTDD